MDVKDYGSVKVVYTPKRLDAQASREVEDVLLKVIESGAKTVLCNFMQTEYISSAGLRVLLTAMKTLKKSEGQLCICTANSFVIEVLETSGLNNVLKIFGTEEEALKNFG
jgi:anti-sigma B factor antagonist